VLQICDSVLFAFWHQQLADLQNDYASRLAEMESFFLAHGSFGPEIFVSEFFWRQSPGFLALQVEGLLAHIVTVLVTYHTYIITMMATTLSTMMSNNGAADALTSPPLLHNRHNYDG
jgi:hypothetical protein